MPSGTNHDGPRTFAEQLQGALDDERISQRELARRLAELKGGKLENERRQVSKWLSGETQHPTRRTRLLVAQALDVKPDVFIAAQGAEAVLLARLDTIEERLGVLEQNLAVREEQQPVARARRGGRR